MRQADGRQAGWRKRWTLESTPSATAGSEFLAIPDWQHLG